MNTCDGLGAMGDVHCAACYVRPCSATQHVRRATQHVRCATGDVRPAARRATCLATAALVLIGGSGSLLACPVCFGAEETSMIDGAKLGILVLLVITLAVQGAF